MNRGALTGAALGLLASVHLGTGCAVGPNYRRPEAPLPQQFRFQPATTAAEARSFADLPWWSLYRDPALQKLLRTALAENLDLRVAAWRVEEARAAAHADLWALTPAVGVDATGQRSRNQTGVPIPQAKGPFGFFTVNANASWELDVWGRLRRIHEASWAQFLASEQNRRAVVSSLVADVATSYFTLRGLDLQRQISRRTVETRQRTLELYRARLKAGIGTATEVANGEAQLAQAQAQEAQVSLQLAQEENRLSILLGRPPGEIARSMEAPLELTVPEIPAGLPSALLERRPDVRAAEEQLVAANAGVGVADANFFPQVSLTAALGVLSPQLADLFSAGAESWRYQGNLSWLAPILAHHQLIDARDEAVARYQQARALWANTVLTALREVSDALVAGEQLRLEEGFLAQQVKALQTQRTLAIARYQAGVASYLEISTAEETLFPAELALARARTQRVLAVISLYRALGGGWQPGP